MADLITELRQRLLEAMDRQSNVRDARKAVDLPSAITNPLNALGGSAITGFDNGFATGYDSGTGITIVPFTTSISVVGSDDRVVGD